MIQIHKIGTTIYLVHKTYVDGKLQNGKVIVGKIKSYQNLEGKVYPIIKEVGTKTLVDIRTHYWFSELEGAIEAITTEKLSKTKISKKTTKTN